MLIQHNDVISYDESFLTKKEANKFFHHLLEFKKLSRMMEMQIPAREIIKHNFGKMMFLDKELIANNAFPQSIWGNNML